MKNACWLPWSVLNLVAIVLCGCGDGAQTPPDETGTDDLLISSTPPGLPVFLAPVETLEQAVRDDDDKTLLAEEYSEPGVPRCVGVKQFAVGVTPTSIPKPQVASVICVVKKAGKEETIEGIRSARGAAPSAHYGPVSMRLDPSGAGLRLLAGTCLLRDQSAPGRGQVQILENRKVRAVILFSTYINGANSIEFSFESDNLYEPLSKHAVSFH